MRAKPNEILIVRVYDAPVKLVWEAWTEEKHVTKWWGPRGFTLTTKSKDLRPGGKWIYTMHGPDGTDYPNITTYHEVVKHEKLVYDHGGNEERQKLFTVTANFKEEKGKTTLTMFFALPSAEEAEAMKGFIKSANGYSTWDRLGEYLEESRGKLTFQISRTLRAPVGTVFEMWSNPEHLSKWLPPAGAKMKFLKAEAREGGESFYQMETPDGAKMWGQVQYVKIEKPSLIIYSQNFADEKGRLCKPAFAPSYPDRALTTVTLSEEAPGETRAWVKWEVFGDATEAELRTFRDMRPGMTQGWGGTFDKLDALLETTR